MMNYAFSIEERDAETTQAPLQPDETPEQYADRLTDAVGKHYFRIVVQEGQSRQFTMLSPLFDKNSPTEKWTTFNTALKGIESAVKTVEKVEKKVEEEKSAIITSGTEQAFKQLRSRN